jgi:hypothetical protein
MTPRAAPALAVLLALPARAAADPPPVKVCVAVAGDPDESVRAGAETVAEAVAAHPALRGVADAEARAALRGDAAPAEFADLAAVRRSLRGSDRDTDALDGLALRLGCGLIVEVMARPAGAAARVYDPVARAWTASREVSSLDAAVVATVVLPALDARHAGTTGAGTTDAGTTDAGTTGAGTTDAGTARSNDRRVAVTPSPEPGFFRRAWPWLLVGGLAAAVLGAYLVADGNTTTSTRVIVSRP